MISTTSQTPAYRTHFNSCEAEAVADAPIDKGGSGSGFGPHELLEAALATCINMAVRMAATTEKMALEGVATSVRLDRSRIDTVSFEYTLDITGSLSDVDRARLFEAANACPIRQTLGKKMEFIALQGAPGAR